MSVILFSNNASSTVQSPIGPGATTVTLAPGTGVKFPNPGVGQYFLATFTDAGTGLLKEIVQCTGVSGDVVTIVRAQEGTSALSWNAGDHFDNLWTAGSAQQMLQLGQLPGTANYALDTGGVNSMIVTLNPAPGTFADLVGIPVRVKVANTNTAATPTLNVNSLGAKNCVSVVPSGAVGVGIGSFAVGEIIELIYDGTNFQFAGRPPASTAQVLAGTDNSSPITSSALASAFTHGVFASGFPSSGYQKLSSGMIIQWGKSTTGTSGGDNFTLPVAFPTAGMVVVSNPDMTLGGPYVYTQAGFQSASQIHITYESWQGTTVGMAAPIAGIFFNYIAFGY